MADDSAPKSAYELAMERLKKKDADEGVERTPVTDAQKAAIAEIRNFYEAKRVEIEVPHGGKMRNSVAPEARAVAEEKYRRDREGLASERAAKGEKTRRA